MNHKSVPQVTLETMMKRNKAESERLLKQAHELLSENREIESRMTAILTQAPQSQPVVRPSQPPSSIRPDPMGGLLHAADALVRSWTRRHKKNFKQLELDLMSALEKVNGNR